MDTRSERLNRANRFSFSCFFDLDVKRIIRKILPIVNYQLEALVGETKTAIELAEFSLLAFYRQVNGNVIPHLRLNSGRGANVKEVTFENRKSEPRMRTEV